LQIDFFNDLAYRSTQTGKAVLATLDIKALSTKRAVDKGFDFMGYAEQDGPIENGYYVRDTDSNFIHNTAPKDLTEYNHYTQSASMAY
jgi:outer membrane receptor for monomeric catechols